MQIPEILRRWYVQLAHVLVIPVFFIIFVLLYNPFGFASYCTSGHGSYTFNVLMLTCIALTVLAVTRGIFHVIFHSGGIRLSWFWYLIWCVCEVMVISQFHTLYLALMRGSAYLPTLGDCMQLDYTVLVYPYVLLVLSYLLSGMTSKDGQAGTPEESLLRFHDENMKLKLVIASGAVLYLQSDENYVKVNYVEAGKLKNYVLRNSMKTIEESARSHGLVRCHRSYIVNPKHVSVLRKDPEGLIVAELDVPGVPAIPVSKRYYDKVSEML